MATSTRNTNTILTDSDGNNRTGTHLSTNIVIITAGNVVGAVQSMNVNEDRGEIKMISEVGTDGVIDSAPTQSTRYTIDIERVRYDRTRLPEALSRGFIHIKSQRIPFDIEVHDRFADADINNAIITIYQNCWFKNLSYSYTVNDWVISDKANLVCEDVFSTLKSGNVAQESANGRAQNIVINPHEASADRGVYRGALDAPGLLDAFLSD